MAHFNKVKPLLYTIAITSIFFMTGCSKDKKTDDLPLNNNQPPIHVYTISATAKDYIQALNEATKVAVGLCSKTKERTEILENHIKYQGMTEKQKEIITKANNTLAKSNGTFSDLDYKITIRFRCLSQDQERSLIRIANQMAGDQVTKKVK